MSKKYRIGTDYGDHGYNFDGNLLDVIITFIKMRKKGYCMRISILED